MATFHYARHFALLACATAGVAAMRPWAPASGLAAVFGFYGALHASTLALASRTAVTARRKLAFAAAAAALSGSCAGLGLWAHRAAAGALGPAEPASFAVIASGFGAAAYAWLIRRCFVAPLTPRAMATIALGCMAATLAVIAAGIHLRAGGMWLAAAWWFAFSVGLCVHDARAPVHGDNRGRIL